jgi:hypothetical protein
LNILKYISNIKQFGHRFVAKEGMLNDEMIVKKPIVLQQVNVQKFTSTNQLDKVNIYKDFKISNG